MSGLRNFRVPERFRRPLKWVGYPAFALAMFVISLYLTLPKQRIQEQVETGVSEWLGSEVKVNESFGLTFIAGPGVTARGVSITLRPINPADKAEKKVRYDIDDVTVRFGLIDLIRGQSGARFNGHLARGCGVRFLGRVGTFPRAAFHERFPDVVSIQDIDELGALLDAVG